ncbi:MAG: carbohydrate-binding family 9-like protein [Bacillota bacterium]
MLAMKYQLNIIFLCLFTCICYSQVIPEPKIKFSPRHYICYRTDMELNIDGKLDEAIWQKAAWTELFADIEGEIKPLPRLKTRAKMLWDDKFLYIAAELEDPDLWATLKQKDTFIYNDNAFEVFIDPDGDTQNYYEFEINAFNTVWDLLLTKPYRMGGISVSAWDIRGLKTAVDIQGTINNPEDKDKGWTVEIAFPLKVLMQCAAHRGLPENGEQWRLNFSRVEWSLEISGKTYIKKRDSLSQKDLFPDYWMWSPHGVIDTHYPEMWGYLQFSGNTAGTKEDSIIRKPEEYAAWVLRQIFYKEKAYYSEHGRYTADLKELNFETQNIPGYLWPAVIEVTSDLIEISVISSDKKNKLYILYDGKIREKTI